MNPELSRKESLVNHARKVIQEINDFAFAFSEDSREKAIAKISYARRLSDSLRDCAINDADDVENEKIHADYFYTIMVSIKPQLDNAISALEETLQPKDPKIEPDEQVMSLEEIENALQESYMKIMNNDD